MSFPAYPAYKDSSVEWLAEVPADWEIKALRSLARTGPNTFIDGDWIETPYITDSGVRLIQTGNVGVGAYKEQGFRYVAESTLAELNCTEVMPGDVLICRLADPVGRACIAPNLAERMITSVDVCILKTEPSVVNRFIVYLLCSPEYLGFMEGQCRGGTRDRVSRSFLGAVRLALPPFFDQSAIAAFLDHETAKIDALVAEQERLIALLKEKRQAVISHAVTKGLDPNAPMKDSGVEWLGQVPAHWEIRKLSSVISKITNGYVGPTRDILVDDGVRYLQSLHIKNNQIRFGDDYFVTLEWSEQHAKSILQTGDVLVVQTGDIGQSAVVTSEFAGANCHALIVISPVHPIISGEWLAWVLNADYGFHTLLSIQTGALHPHLNCGNVKDIFIPLPPIDQQRAIVAEIQARARSFDELISEATHAIVLLRERRAALISAAVTGKIDLRGFVRPEQQAA